jgi:hypothetical protein
VKQTGADARFPLIGESVDVQAELNGRGKIAVAGVLMVVKGLVIGTGRKVEISLPAVNPLTLDMRVKDGPRSGSRDGFLPS